MRWVSVSEGLPFPEGQQGHDILLAYFWPNENGTLAVQYAVGFCFVEKGKLYHLDGEGQRHGPADFWTRVHAPGINRNVQEAMGGVS